MSVPLITTTGEKIVPDEDLQALLRAAIDAARSGNRNKARELLHRLVARDPGNELAWLWLATVASSEAERRASLKRVLAINPGNERARQALAQLDRAAQVPDVSTRAPAAEGASSLSARRQRGLPPWLFWTLTVVAFGLGAVALVLLWLDRRSGTTPSASSTFVVAPSPTSTRVAAQPTSTPIGGVLRTLPPRDTLPPTWTPTATRTPTPTPLPTNTPPPLESYTLLASGQLGQSGWRLFTLRGDGTEPVSLDLTPAASDLDADVLPVFVGVYDAALSPDGSQIAFTGRLARSHLEGDTVVTEEFEDLFVAPARGGTARRLTRLEAVHVGEAAWSPDGRTIAFAADPAGNFDLFLVALESGQLTTLVPGSTNDREPSWSPDGQWIAFTSDRSGPGATEIWRVGVSGGPYKQLTDNVNSSFSPAWSPDGQWIVFLSNRRVSTDLYVMTANGDGERALLVRDVPAEERDPAWSPDGRWIAFSANRERPIFDLYVIRPDGSGLQRMFGGDGDTRYPVWYP